MKRFLLTIAIAMCSTLAFSQSITLSFTGQTIRGRYVDMDSIRINNLTQGWTATLVAPDTSCSFDLTAIKINSTMPAELSQNVPNPFHGTTEVNLALPQPDKVTMQALDMGGRVFANYNGNLPEGEHHFEISLASPQGYLLSATTSSGTSSVKMVNLGSGGANRISYLGQVEGKSLRDGGYDLTIGDALECIGYTTYCDSIYESELYTTTITEGSDTECQLRFNLRSGGTVDEVTACDFYQWINRFIYTESTDTATCTLTNSMGCDSVVTLHLTINHSYGEGRSITACDFYEYDGTTYTESGMSTHRFSTVEGCDSTIYLYLTIEHPETHEIDSTVCDSYEWEGQTYTDDRTVSTTYENQYGCDSTIVVNFHVNHSTETIDTREECDSFVWIDGNTYTESNNEATYTYIAENGCDSVVRLNVTIVHSNNPIYEVTASECSYYRMSNGEYLTESGDYQRTLQSSCGCDSIVLLHLTITGEDGLEGTFYDERDDRTYRTIQYGCQTWFAEDLLTTHYANGSNAPSGQGATCGNYSSNGYYDDWYVWGNNYGYCPSGWHLPSQSEWELLIDYMRIREEYNCNGSMSVAKAMVADTGWTASDVECSPGYNQSENNFSGLGLNPAGMAFLGRIEKAYYGQPYERGEKAMYFAGSSDLLIINYNSYNIFFVDVDTYPCYGFKIRCVRDN